MKRKRVLSITVVAVYFLFSVGCSSTGKRTQMKSVHITANTIRSDFMAKPDTSINIKQLKKHFDKYPERWNSVFKLLVETDLKSLEPGRIDINENVYAVVSEYETKNPLDAKYESHRKFIDLQYIISGEEYIGLTHRKDLDVISPYDEEKDIAFFEFDGGDMLLASPSTYFIFFPEDIHRPCIQVNEASIVRKIVFKIQVN
ncbi:YhcH/YjgK/YiaL family protein [Maribellus sediminis]|uniref:YhcH/YjgK/YiaL family protein n=1 Tax=Maribellus sediminis TaxID=2696285 RepID=UPI0014303264|nr:YhcH/YjgK/YiaL family protein [Maribellus sediminis]